MSLLSIVSVCALLILGLSLRIAWVLLMRSRRKVHRKADAMVETLIVLGSGGHTAEMLQLLQSLDLQRYHRRHYIVGDDDPLSGKKARAMESQRGGIEGQDFELVTVPRARAVGQSKWTAPFTLSRTLISCVQVLALRLPDLVLCNGPGNCVAVALTACMAKVLGIKDIQIVYVESFARVKTLSLTGKLLYPIVDRFLVQWPDLVSRYPRSEYVGVLI